MNDKDRARELFFEGLARFDKRDFHSSEKFFLETLKLAPRSVPTLTNLAIAQYEQGKIEESALTARTVLEIDPKNIQAYVTLSTCQKDQHHYDDAIETCQKIISIDPAIPEVHYNLGFAFNKIQNYKEAIRSFDRAIELNPQFVDAFLNRGNVLNKIKRCDEAILAYDHALALKPDFLPAWLARGNACLELKNFGEACAAYDNALTLKSDYAEAWLGRGHACFYLKRYDEALAAYDRALSAKPDLLDGWLGRGNTYFELKRYNEALDACDHALATEPNFAAAWLSRANVLQELGRHDEAARSYAKLLEIDASYPFAKGRLLHQKMLICDWTGASDLIDEIENDLASGKRSAEPFGWQGVATTERSLQLCAQIYNQSEFPAKLKPQTEISRAGRGKKIRVGYLSGEFRDQATSHLLVGVLENHDPGQFDIYAFDNGWDDNSEIRRRINASTSKIIDISEVSDRSAVEMISDNQIDILVNLNGYFGRHRMGVFAERPAPIQVNYLGFPGTLGATYIDYIIADECVLPESHRIFYNEKVVYLPNCYQANDHKKKIGSHIFSRLECGLPEVGFVFCCFNKSYKITPDTFDCWIRILKQVEGSVLWLFESNLSAARNLKRRIENKGINPDRLVFSKPLPLPDHLARLAVADLCLDTLPYNAHTTASDALWVGLPILTQIGTTFAGRVAASLLNAIGLPELVTSTEQAFEALAVELANNPDKLKDLRQMLSSRRYSAPLFDTQLFTHNIEKAYCAMNDRFQTGLPPDHIRVFQ